MQYIIGILLGIIGVLFLQNRKVVIPSEEKEKLNEATQKIESNKDLIKKEEEKLNAAPKKESKTLSQLADYFKRNKR
jgi:hypothetical protein